MGGVIIYDNLRKPKDKFGSAYDTMYQGAVAFKNDYIRCAQIMAFKNDCTVRTEAAKHEEGTSLPDNSDNNIVY